MVGRHNGNANIELLAPSECMAKPTVLARCMFVGAQTGEHFDTRDNFTMHRARQLMLVYKHPIDAKSRTRLRTLWIDVDVGGAERMRFFEQAVEQGYGRPVGSARKFAFNVDSP